MFSIFRRKPRTTPKALYKAQRRKRNKAMRYITPYRPAPIRTMPARTTYSPTNI